MYYLKRRQRSRLDATSALKGVGKRRGSPLGEDVALIERLVIIYKLVKSL